MEWGELKKNKRKGEKRDHNARRGGKKGEWCLCVLLSAFVVFRGGLNINEKERSINAMSRGKRQIVCQIKPTANPRAFQPLTPQGEGEELQKNNESTGVSWGLEKLSVRTQAIFEWCSTGDFKRRGLRCSVQEKEVKQVTHLGKPSAQARAFYSKEDRGDNDHSKKKKGFGKSPNRKCCGEMDIGGPEPHRGAGSMGG